jgi:hypothetical protein
MFLDSRAIELGTMEVFGLPGGSVQFREMAEGSSARRITLVRHIAHSHSIKMTAVGCRFGFAQMEFIVGLGCMFLF